MEKGTRGSSRPRPRFWPAGRSRPSPPARLPPPCARAHVHATHGHAVPPWRAGRARPPRGAHASAWTRPGRPPRATGCARLLLRCHLCPSTLSLALSFAHAQQRPAPSFAIATDARSFFLWQLRPSSTNPQPPASPPRPPAPSVRTQSP